MPIKQLSEARHAVPADAHGAPAVQPAAGVGQWAAGDAAASQVPRAAQGRAEEGCRRHRGEVETRSEVGEWWRLG